jgi:hypothetical protein
MNKMSFEEYHSIKNYGPFCRFHGISYEDPYDWRDFWELLGNPKSKRNYTEVELYNFYLQWYEIINSPLYQLMQEND